MDIRINRHASAGAFLARARDWLLQREAEHNLILGLAAQVESGARMGYEPPLYFATIEGTDEVLGCAWRTPPFKLGLTAIPPGSAARLAEDVAEVYATIPAVMGREADAVAVAERLCQLRGGRVSVTRRHRIHEARRIVMPAAPPPGSLRPATADDLPLATAWMLGFFRDTAQPSDHHASLAGRLVAQGSLYIWEDRGPRSMVAATGATAHGIRIAYVYTPADDRGKGYASIAVGTLSARLLREGRQFCVLYTDLANPVSNSIYARLGYRGLVDVADADIVT